MSLLAAIRRLVQRAYPAFPENYVTRLGVVVAIADPPQQEVGTDEFRPRYAVDVQLLTPQGEEDTARPVLEGLALPSHGGIYAFPELGQRVRVGFDYGLPSCPYIVEVLNVGQPTPRVLPGERVWQHSEGHFARWDAKGNLHIQLNGELREDSHTRVIEADAVSETLGRVTRIVQGELVESIGNWSLMVLGAYLLSVGADSKVAILGVDDRTVGGDKAELVGGLLEVAANLGVKISTVPAIGTIAIGNGLVELLTILDAVLTQLQTETHLFPASGGAPTSPPVNLALYLAEQVKLLTIKQP